MTSYYVILSGDNIGLAQVEVESLLHLIEKKFCIRWFGKLGVIECRSNPLPLLLERAALVREAGNVLVEEEQTNDLVGKVTPEILESVFFEKRSFSIIYHELEKVVGHGEKQKIVEALGARIQSLTKTPVSLKQPETRVSVISTTESCIIGEAFESAQRKMLGLREPSKKPFFHPSMMNSILARVMCNIGEVKPNHLVLDPFCGGGSILCEASLIGARVIGIDMNWKLLNGAKTNLVHQDTHQFSLLQGDSRFLPVRKYDCIITDPPYGRSSSTRGAHAINLVDSMIGQTICSGNHLVFCICASQDMNLKETFIQYGLSIEASVLIRVHSGLTREVFKLRN